MGLGYTRRRFLKQTAQTVLGASASLSVAGLSPSEASAQVPCDDWGALPNPALGGVPVGTSTQWTCANHAGYKILEIWLDEGASLWETFWIPGSGGSPDLSAMNVDALGLDSIDWMAGASAEDPCDGPDHPTSFADTYAFGTSTDNQTIYWGPAAKPLWYRPDIMARARMLGLGHALLPHQAAQPYGLSGLPLGNPRRAGTGSAIQRRHTALNPDAILPVSFVFHRGLGHRAAYAAETGSHPGTSRPLVVGLSDTDVFSSELARTQINPASDSLFNALRRDYGDRQRWLGQGARVRSSGHQSYRVAAELLVGATNLQQLFGTGTLTIDGSSSTCPQVPGSPPAGYFPHLKTGLAAAAQLLSQNQARYACVMDKGITGMYDTHSGDRQKLYPVANLLNVSRQLARLIRDPIANPNGPIDLNDTLIVINSEFGRTPLLAQGGGRDHWPWGYNAMLIGGPITSGSRGIRGGFDAEGAALPGLDYTPTDLRGAMLLAAGVDPFAPGGFRVDDFSAALRATALTETDIRSRLVETVFGA